MDTQESTEMNQEELEPDAVGEIYDIYGEGCYAFGHTSGLIYFKR